MVRAINEAWMMIAVLTVAAVLCVPFCQKAIVGANARVTAQKCSRDSLKLSYVKPSTGVENKSSIM
jgi:hypothetical protein